MEVARLKRLIPLGYLGSIILFLTGIIYFFAANWPLFSRFEKLTLSVSAMLLFYVVSVLSTRLLPHQLFLGKWFLVAGAISFGISVGLIGQIYNSHADSYMLFVIWFIPTIIFAFVTRYLPFWVLSYVLFHLSYWFYMNPSSYTVYRTDFEEWLTFFILVIINLCLFGLTFTKYFSFTILRYFSYLAVHGILIGISFIELFKPYSGWTNLLYILFAVWSYFYFAKKTDRALTIILFIMGSLYIYVKVIELPFLFDFGFLGIQLAGVLTSLILIFGGVLLAKKITNHSHSSGWHLALKKTLIVIVTLIGSMMFVSSFGGILFMITSSEYATVFVSLLFIGSGLLFTKLDSTARHTLLMIGFFSGLAEAIFLSTIITVLFLAVSIIVTIFIKDGIIRLISYTTAIGCSLTLVLDDLNLHDSLDLVFISFLIINAILAYFFRSYKDITRIGTFYSIGFMFALTFLDKTIALDVVYSLIFFILTTALLVFFSRKNEVFLFKLTVFFWFAFLVSSYYDFVWSLIHKSASLIVIGFIIFVITRIMDRKQSVQIDTKGPNLKWGVILMIIFLQLGILSFQIITSESTLRNGKEITLKLAPLDPRSLIQGDFVRLRYEVGELENEKIPYGDKIYVILEAGSDGTYTRKEVITDKINPKEYQLKENEVLMAGRYNGYDTINFGIESFFVKEGTGLEVERNATHAKVMVSQVGNAILVTVE